MKLWHYPSVFVAWKCGTSLNDEFHKSLACVMSDYANASSCRQQYPYLQSCRLGTRVVVVEGEGGCSIARGGRRSLGFTSSVWARERGAISGGCCCCHGRHSEADGRAGNRLEGGRPCSPLAFPSAFVERFQILFVVSSTDNCREGGKKC